MSRKRDSDRKRDNGVIALWGLGILSVGYAIGIIFYFNTATNDTGALLKTSLSLGEMGDYLTGFFSPLAFMWFVTAVLLQWRELRLQRLELMATQKISQEQAEAQKQSSISARRQMFFRIAEEAQEVVLAILSDQRNSTLLRDTIRHAWAEGVGGRLALGAVSPTELIRHFNELLKLTEERGVAIAFDTNVVNLFSDIHGRLQYVEREAEQAEISDYFYNIFIKTPVGIFYEDLTKTLEERK